MMQLGALLKRIGSLGIARAALARMVGIVQPDGDEIAGTLDRWSDACPPRDERQSLRIDLLRLAHRAGRKGHRVDVRDDVGKVADPSGPVEDAWFLAALRPVTEQFHLLVLLGNGCSKRAGEQAAIDQDVLAGDVAGMGRAEEGADLAEFLDGAEAPGGNLGDRAGGKLLDLGAGPFSRPFPAGGQPFGIHAARQDVVDGDVSVGDLAADPGEERRQAGAGAGREIESRDRRQNGVRGDVDDAAEAAPCHAVDHGADQLDRRHHVLDDAGDDCRAVEVAEIPARRAAIVVDQDIRFRAGGDQRLLHAGI